LNINICRSTTICNSISLGSSSSFRGWVWWLLKPSRYVSDTKLSKSYLHTY